MSISIGYFGKQLSLFFSNKGYRGTNIMEKDDVMQYDEEIAKKLNDFTQTVVSKLDINENSRNIADSIDRAIELYKYHPSIILIKEKIRIKTSFHLSKFLYPIS